MSIKIVLLGFGAVVSDVPFLSKENQSKTTEAAHDTTEIIKVLARDGDEKNRLLAAGNDYNFVTSVDDTLNDDSIGIVIELMRCTEPTCTLTTEAPGTGKNVVPASKDLIAIHGKGLIELARDKGATSCYEAATAGGIPTLRTFTNSLTSDKVTRILGVLSGTSNFMMTKMADEGWTREDAFKTARELDCTKSGLANDIKDIDATYKAVILSQSGFGMTINFDGVAHKGVITITPDDAATTQEFDYVIKLVGDACEVRSGISAEVLPTSLPKARPLASISDVMNAVFVELVDIGESMYYGSSAGQKPTATFVITGIIHACHRTKDGNAGKPFNELVREIILANPVDVKSHYYFMINTPGKEGQLLCSVEIFDSKDISSKQALQQEANDTRARVVIIIHLMSKAQLIDVTAKLEAAEDLQVANIPKVLSE